MLYLFFYTQCEVFMCGWSISFQNVTSSIEPFHKMLPLLLTNWRVFKILTIRDTLIYVFIFCQNGYCILKCNFKWTEMKSISYLQNVEGIDVAVEGGVIFIFLIGYTPSLRLISMKSFVWPPGQCPWNLSDSLVKTPHHDKLSYWYTEWWFWFQSACVLMLRMRVFYMRITLHII